MIEMLNICKTFGENEVIKDFSYKFDNGKKYAILGPSGIGKTTLLNIISGLVKPTSGNVIYDKNDYRFSFDFQEDRLFENFSSIKNIKAVSKSLSEETIIKELSKLLPETELTKPVSHLSGGMRRRVCLVRSMIFNSDCVILDEPFSGLDDENIKIALNYILDNIGTRILIMTSHSFNFPSDFIKIEL